MTEEIAQFDSEIMNMNFDKTMQWAQLLVTIQEIAEDDETLIRDLSAYDLKTAVPLLAGLLTLPEYQSNCIRLEILVALAVAYCHGQKKAHFAQAEYWFSQIGKSRCVLAEDPAEDVFVSLIQDDHGDYRLLGGIWEGAGFYTQLILDVVRTMPDEGEFERIKKSTRALITISDIVCEKSALHRYQLGSDERRSVLSSNKTPGRNALVSRVTISFADLEKHGIKRVDIEPFIFPPHRRNALIKQRTGHSDLDRYPLIMQADTHVVVALPSSLTVAIRSYVIESAIKSGLVTAFDKILAKKYTQLFTKTPLLGGPTHAPVHWRKLDDHRWTNFCLEVDEGYYISYHLYLPSIQTHVKGGFESTYVVEGVLHKALQDSIDETQTFFSDKSDFKQGLVVLVGCNWGNSYVTQRLKLDRPDWRFQSITAADLIRLSWLEEMNPSYIWRIQDGKETVTNAGVHIVNPNGILNLIGWVRSNHGHFIPYKGIPEGEVSPEKPLDLYPPLNLLREVRATADQGYDRHCSLDNTGVWHDVQHFSPNPLFYNENNRRIYASMDDAYSGTLTSVYEGAIILWISVSTPYITEKDTQYRLWEMANEWLHRIGSILDVRAETATTRLVLKVYIEFCDTGPPKAARVKPSREELALLCTIETHTEPNACKAVFRAGFLDGFLIAENVAERLFVRNVARGFLQLLGVEENRDEAKAIEVQVVQNNEARNFHFFHAQSFIDYVRETFTKKLVAIDPIDEATTRIGLGWRVMERSQGNRVEGREACTRFLEKIVDVLVDDIVVALATFDRLSTLKRLVTNCEKASDKGDHWKRTSAAVLGLHGQSPETVSIVVEQMSKYDGASIASRILIEIALCTCPPEDGSQLSSIEMSKLIARAGLVVHLGGLSDAIHYNVLAPEITISPLGDILFRNEFGHLVVNPMLSKIIGNQFIENAPLQKKNYEEPEIIADSKEKVGDEFWEVWTNEMGFNPDEARNIIGALEDKGVRDHTAIFEISQSEYYSLVCSNSLVSEAAAAKFLNQFSLKTRAQWDKPPEGFVLKDIYPWRFGRRLSFRTRPILKTDDSDDPLLTIAPGALRTGFVYVFSGAHSGQFEQSFFHTKEMKNTWWGKAREGHSFNSAVAQILSEAGWQIRQNLGLPELLNCKLERDFGDIDVLAWRVDRNEVIVVECKDLSPALNYSEIAVLLSDYQGTGANGEPDKLRKHLDRVTLVEENKQQLQNFTKIQRPEIVSCLICSGVVPMQYAKVEALKGTHVGSVEEILAVV